MGLGLGFGFLAMALHLEGFVHDWVAPSLTVVLTLAVIILLVCPFVMRVFGKRTMKQFFKAAPL